MENMTEAAQSGMTLVLQGHTEKAMEKASKDGATIGFVAGALTLGVLWAMDHFHQVEMVSEARQVAGDATKELSKAKSTLLDIETHLRGIILRTTRIQDEAQSAKGRNEAQNASRHLGELLRKLQSERKASASPRLRARFPF